jgi:RNA polymerase sigma factor (sigma-70 family)
MKDINKTIKSYEPMMHKVIRKFKIKRDYEDILQQLRIKTWEVLRDRKYKKIYRNEKGQIIEAKLSTLLYTALTNALLNILKTDYGFKVTGKTHKVEEQEIDKQIKFYLKNPILCGLPFLPIESETSENELKSKLDFEQFYNTQTPEDKHIIDLMKFHEGNKKEVATELKCTLRSINRKLLKLKNNYKKYLTGSN